MKKPALVILAAGMGSRYGGLKQMDPMDPMGHAIIDYSIYDAKRAGFGKVVFVIKKAIEKDFKETVGARVPEGMEVCYAYQEVDALPEGYNVPEGRVKPWGTAHAILCAKDNIHEPFVIINADDFYGKDAYKVASNFLKNVKEGNNYCLVGYKVANTLTENGAVKRGICKLENGNLTELIESNVEKIDGKIIAKPLDGREPFFVTEDTYVSMNMLCFTPSIFKYIEERFPKFLENHKDDILKAEYLIPDLLERLTLEGITETKVLPTDAKWIGVTYKEDKEKVVESIKKLVEANEYPNKLWK